MKSLILPKLPSPHPVEVNDRVGLIEWAYVLNHHGKPIRLQCALKYRADDCPRKICVGAALDLPERLWNVIEQDATVIAFRETLRNPIRDDSFSPHARN